MLLAQFFWDGALFLVAGGALGFGLCLWKERSQRKSSLAELERLKVLSHLQNLRIAPCQRIPPVQNIASFLCLSGLSLRRA